MSTMATQLAESLRGDREAFGRLIQQYQNTVYAVVYSITGNLQQSEDLSQETFVTAWLQLRDLRDESKFPAWLCGIARNLAQNWVRTNAWQKTPMAQSDLVGHLAAAEHDPAEIALDEPPETLDRQAQAAMVWEILRDLPESYREPLVLYYQQSQSIGDIAAALDLSEANVRQRLSRGRAKIREEVAGRIEQALATFQPDKMFYLAVLAALPVATLSTSQAVAATFAAATGVKIAGGTGGGTFGTATGATTFWGVLLNILITVFWVLFFPLLIAFAMTVHYAQLRDLPTLRSRRAHLKYHLLFLGIMFSAMNLFFAGILLVPLKVIPDDDLRGWMDILVNVFFWLPLIGALMLGCYFRIRTLRVLEEDLGKCPAPDVPLEESPLSLRSVKRALRFLTIAVSVAIAFFAGIFGGMLVVYSFPVSPLAAILAGFVTLVVIVGLIALIVRFLQLLLVMATEDGLLRYPPKETYTVLKFKPHDRWWRKPEPEKPLAFRDYFNITFPGVIFAMMLLFGCQGTNASTEALLLAVLPMLLGGPVMLFALRDVKNVRVKASNIFGAVLLLWMLFAICWLLYEPLTSKWGTRMIFQYIVMLVLIMVVGIVAMRRNRKSEVQE